MSMLYYYTMKFKKITRAIIYYVLTRFFSRLNVSASAMQVCDSTVPYKRGELTDRTANNF